jgi:NhaA family Na+:H+ antiporter
MTLSSWRGSTSLARVLKPLERFLHVESASGIVLLICAVCAMLWANSPWSSSYQNLWNAQPGRFLINEILMTAFFFVIGLEIRRELHDGTLSSVRTASLPIVAAAGGIVAPAAIYLVFNWDAEVRAGWAIPTATDIAFAVGVLAMLGKRVNPALRVLLLSLAIADDVAAILIIAIFYADGVGWRGVTIAAAALAALLLLRRQQIRAAPAYLIVGGLLWFGMLDASLHPVLAGVIVGIVMPQSPAERLETTLHPWVAYGVMPLFALANAGIGFANFAVNERTWALTGSVALALVVGKPLGIVVAAAIAVRLGWCQLPEGITWRGVALVGCLGGIGFTMSIFIATLAFPDAALLAAAKLGVLAASTVAGGIALLIGFRWFKSPPAAIGDRAVGD